MLDEWEMLYLGTGIVMCRRITTDRMSDPSSVHGGHGALGTGEQVQVHANVQTFQVAVESSYLPPIIYRYLGTS